MIRHFFSAFLMASMVSLASAQSFADKPPTEWHLLSTEVGFPGIRSNEALEHLKGRQAQTVIVAVLDSGVDIFHEDLQGQLWTNSGEIPGNGIDDDGNGYVDDVHGWNFIGGAEANVIFDNLEFTRVYKGLHDRFKDADPKKIKKADKNDYQRFLKMQKDYDKRVEKAASEYNEVLQLLMIHQLAKNVAAGLVGKEDYTAEDLRKVQTTDEMSAGLVEFALFALENDFEAELDEYMDHFSETMTYSYNMELDTRQIVGDNYADKNERYYGNSDVKGERSKHGTHVAGIIGAARNNNIGMDGIADHVLIMPVRVVPMGDERDKDIANAIYYAVDNGARVINMSFGKSLSPDKWVVDEAVRYAEEKDVLLIHAAGNDARNNDVSSNFPNAIYEKENRRFTNWLEVGASNYSGPPSLPAEFSNYGKQSVDLFAPGNPIYSTTPEDTYKFESGTSMAAPVVAGVAAIIRAYFPQLTAADVRHILMQSVTDYSKEKVTIPGKDKTDLMSNICVTGGVVNALAAVKMAETYTPGSAPKPAPLKKAKKKKK